MMKEWTLGSWALGIGQAMHLPRWRVFISSIALALCTSAYAEPPAADTPSTQPATQAPPAKANQPAKKPSTKPSTTGTSKESAQPAAATKHGADRLELDTSVVTGNRELPKVLYIVPWKKADLGDLPAQPFNTLLDEALTPVDRDVFRREVSYYQAVTSGATGTGAAKESK